MLIDWDNVHTAQRNWGNMWLKMPFTLCQGLLVESVEHMQTVYMQSEYLKVIQATNQTSLKSEFYLIESTFIEKSLAGEN